MRLIKDSNSYVTTSLKEIIASYYRKGHPIQFPCSVYKVAHYNAKR